MLRTAAIVAGVLVLIALLLLLSGHWILGVVFAAAAALAIALFRQLRAVR